MNLLLLLVFVTSSSFAFTLNNNFGASFKKSKVKVYVAGNTTCTGAGLNVYSLQDLVKPAVEKFWNKVPTSKLRLKPSGFTAAINNINSGRLCSPTDTDCITAAGANLIPQVTDIVIACNIEPLNFGGAGVLAVTIPNNFSGRRIRGAVILINDTALFGNLSTNDKISVIAHEIGHAIGLGHAEDKNKDALMYYKVVDLRRSLGQDDIDGVTYLYPKVVDGCGLMGTLDTKGGNGKGPSFWEMGLGLMLMILIAELRKVLKRPHARATA
jgi:Matrixin